MIKTPISLQSLIHMIMLPMLVLLLAGCGSMVNLITATPDASQRAALTAQAEPAGQTDELATPTRRPRATLTTSAPTGSSTRATRTPGPQVNDGLQTMTVDQLPPEARQTLAHIDSGGPFPYSRDGIVFQNREGILPKQSSGYYHEYTVVTPGAQDRGARRLIAGSNDEIYYTDDHYVTFKRVIR